MQAKRIMPMRATALLALAAAALCLASSCRAQADRPQKTLPRASISVKGVRLDVEIARSQDEQAKGLMFRKSLEDGRGMIFVYDTDRQLSFWMKNTLIPLSIAYIRADGIITDILDMTPLSTAPVTTRHYVRYALEVPQGWFLKNDIHAGDRFDLSGLPAR